MANYALSDSNKPVHCPHCETSLDSPASDFVVPSSSAKFKDCCDFCGGQFTVQYTGGNYLVSKL